MNKKENIQNIVLKSNWNKENYKKVTYNLEKNYGSLKKQNFIVTLFSLLLLVFLFFLYLIFIEKYEKTFSTVWAPLCGILFSIAFLYYYIIFIPNLTKKQAENVFDSNKFFKLPFKVSLFEDFLVYENKFEHLTSYWTEILFCVETNDDFIIKSTTNMILILEKSELSDQEIENTRDFLKNKLVNRYIKWKIS